MVAGRHRSASGLIVRGRPSGACLRHNQQHAQRSSTQDLQPEADGGAQGRLASLARALKAAKSISHTSSNRVDESADNQARFG